MTWTIETIGKFLESKQNNPTEHLRLCREDPTFRMLTAMKKAESDYRMAHEEHHALAPVEISSDPVRLAEVESIMSTALATRDRMKAGLEQACAALGDQQEPTVQAMQSRAAYLRRTRQGGEAAALDVLCVSLESIATQAGV